MKARPPILIYAESNRNGNQRYFTGFSAGDAFLSLQLGRKRCAVLGALEFARARRESDLDLVLAAEDLRESAKRILRRDKIGTAEFVAYLARSRRQRRFLVPADFPLGLARQIKAWGIKLEIPDGPLFPGRQVKSRIEAAKIRRANGIAEQGFAAALEIFRAARIKGRSIVYRGAILTSERVQEAIDVACLRAGAVVGGTIVAGGEQACDPHCRGHGPLRPNELIVVDIFPRDKKTGYYGDMTRTFLKGRASDAQRNLVGTVWRTQRVAFRLIRAGTTGDRVHQGVVQEFAAQGYVTKRSRAGSIGFFHGTGHGVGLDLHEGPSLSTAPGQRLRRGEVVTVEPGLYYPSLGGCRIEDVVQVTAGAPRLLSRFGYEWEIA